jgi:hypothetical protein
VSTGIASLCWLLAVACSLSARALRPGDATQSAAQQKLNPLADATKGSATLSDLHGPDGDSQPNLNFEPIIPFPLSGDWRVVTRVLVDACQRLVKPAAQ